MLAKTNSSTVDGIIAIPVTIEVNVVPLRSEGGTRMTIVGLPDNSVKESHSRIEAALAQQRLQDASRQHVTVNLAPGDIRKEGTGFDLPIALGILYGQRLCAQRLFRAFHDGLGELSLDGSLQPIRGATAHCHQSPRVGLRRAHRPEQNVHEAAVVNRLKVYGAQNLTSSHRFPQRMGQRD